MRENRTHGSEGEDGESRSPTPIRLIRRRTNLDSRARGNDESRRESPRFSFSMGVREIMIDFVVETLSHLVAAVLALSSLRLMIRFRAGPVTTGPYFVTLVPIVVKILLRFGIATPFFAYLS